VCQYFWLLFTVGNKGWPRASKAPAERHVGNKGWPRASKAPAERHVGNKGWPRASKAPAERHVGNKGWPRASKAPAERHISNNTANMSLYWGVFKRSNTSNRCKPLEPKVPAFRSMIKNKSLSNTKALILKNLKYF
jgi:hypothetical protein